MRLSRPLSAEQLAAAFERLSSEERVQVFASLVWLLGHEYARQFSESVLDLADGIPLGVRFGSDQARREARE